MGKWEEKELEDICYKITDGTHQTPTYFDDGYIFLSSKNVTSQKIDWDNVKYVDEKQHNKFQKRISPKIGDILLAKNGTTGVAAMVDRNVPFDIYVSLAWLRSKGEVIPEYLLYFVNSENAKQQFNKRLKGVGVPNLHLKEIKKVLVPFPKEIPEQKRIVAKLDGLFEKIDRAINLLEESIAHTEALMGSVLDEEFKKVQEKGWPTLKFTDFAYLRHGHQFRKYDFVESGIPVVKIGQCKKDGSLDLSNCNYIESSRLAEFKEDRIYKGDLLMALTGGTLGKVTWVSEDYGDLVQNYRVGNFFNIQGKSIKRFLMYILMSSIFQDLVASKVNQGAQPNIGKENIDNMVVPIPSIKEQE